jgi:23S rRNA (pseudouridine1915-N3)-methyltransferase
VFLLGGAEGFAEETKKEADVLLSLSQMTFPHELARVVLLEQLYRAWALLREHPYPK